MDYFDVLLKKNRGFAKEPYKPNHQRKRSNVSNATKCSKNKLSRSFYQTKNMKKISSKMVKCSTNNRPLITPSVCKK